MNDVNTLKMGYFEAILDHFHNIFVKRVLHRKIQYKFYVVKCLGKLKKGKFSLILFFGRNFVINLNFSKSEVPNESAQQDLFIYALKIVLRYMWKA